MYVFPAPSTATPRGAPSPTCKAGTLLGVPPPATVSMMSMALLIDGTRAQRRITNAVQPVFGVFGCCVCLTALFPFHQQGQQFDSRGSLIAAAVGKLDMDHRECPLQPLLINLTRNRHHGFG